MRMFLMLNVLKMRFAQIADSVRIDGWRSFFKQAAFLRRTAILVEKDLSEVVERPEPLVSSQLKLREIDKDMLSSGTYSFAVASRYLKAVHHIKQEWRGFGLVRNNVIVGDMWYYVADATDDPSVLHVDLQRFGFQTWQASHVYTFDIFVSPAERKQGLSAAFQNNAMLCLALRGYTKAYGYYFADNIPAIWCTRVTNKWKEVRAVSMSRFLLVTRVVPLRRDQAGDRVLRTRKASISVR
jgi:hypothetical protein